MSDARRRAPAWAVLAAILTVLCVFKVIYDPYPIGNFGQDAGLYYNIARHVAEGDGLLTSVSTQNQGIKKLPFPTSAYPLWPFLLGKAGVVVGLDRAVVWLPNLLFVVSLVLLYRLTNIMTALWEDANLAGRRPIGTLTLGHVMVIIFGFNPVYFKFTSLPFTEGLAFTLLFATLLALYEAGRGRTVLWGAVAGGLAALGYLTRYQFLGLAVVVPIAFLMVGIRHRPFRIAAAVSLLAGLMPIAGWVHHVGSSYGAYAPGMLVDFSALRQTPELEPYQFIVHTSSIADFLGDRLWGAVSVAFNPLSRFSYVRDFGAAAYLLPLAAVYFVVHAASVRSAIRHLTDPRYLVAIGTVGAGLLCLAQVHGMHANRFGGWFFQFRQGLPLILGIVISSAFLATRPSPPVRIGLALVLVISCAWIGVQFTREVQKREQYHGPTAAQRELSRWIDQQVPTPVFAATDGYVLAGLTRGLFHSVSCDENAAQMTTYFERVGVSYLITEKDTRECAYFTSVRDSLEQVQTFGAGTDEITVWRIKTLPKLAGVGSFR